MSPAPREARLELDAALRRPLPRHEAEALVALLCGHAPMGRHPHALFRHDGAAALLTGESLDHDTRGSRVLHEGGVPRLAVSASIPPIPGLLEAGLDWLGGLLEAEAGAVLGFVVPPGSHRHDLRLVVWDGIRPLTLGALPEPSALAGGCGMAAFQQAAGLPPPEAEEAVLAPAMRRVALAQAARQALPVSQSALDGPFAGQALFRAWLAAAAAHRHGFTTAAPLRMLDAA